MLLTYTLSMPLIYIRSEASMLIITLDYTVLLINYVLVIENSQTSCCSVQRKGMKLRLHLHPEQAAHLCAQQLRIGLTELAKHCCVRACDASECIV